MSVLCNALDPDDLYETRSCGLDQDHEGKHLYNGPRFYENRDRALRDRGLTVGENGTQDTKPRCWRCRKLLAELVTRPWAIVCMRCKAVNQSPPAGTEVASERRMS